MLRRHHQLVGKICTALGAMRCGAEEVYVALNAEVLCCDAFQRAEWVSSLTRPTPWRLRNSDGHTKEYREVCKCIV